MLFGTIAIVLRPVSLPTSRRRNSADQRRRVFECQYHRANRQQRASRIGRFNRFVDHTLPKVSNPAWVRTPVDHFILAGLETVRTDAVTAS